MTDAFQRPRSRIGGVDERRRVQRSLREQAVPSGVQQRGVAARAENARNEAVAAAEQAQQVKEEVQLDQMVDPGNLFDYAPIIAKDASLFWTARQPTPGTAYYEPAGVPNIVEWFPDGFTVESTQAGLLAIGNRRTFNMGPEVRYNTRFSAAFSPTSNPWPNYVYARLGLWVGPYSWPAVDGPIGLDQPVIGSPTLTPNPGYDREFYYPDSTWAISTFPGDPDRTTWRPAITLNFTAAGQRFTIRKIRMQVIAGTLDFTGGSTIPGGSLVNGSVTANKLDPSISFGVADGAVTTPKLADRAVTAPKIALASVAREHVAPLQGALATFKPTYQQHSAFATTEVIVGMDGVVQCYFATSAASAMTVNANTGYIFASIPAEFAPAIATVRICYGATSLGRTFIRVNPNGDLVFEGNATGTFAVGNTLVLGELSWRMKTT